jgi:hypothetical protein
MFVIKEKLYAHPVFYEVRQQKITHNNLSTMPLIIAVITFSLLPTMSEELLVFATGYKGL